MKTYIATKDPGKGHFWISMVKSAVRIVGAIFLMTGNLLIGGACFLAAEILGVAEELV